MDWHFHFIMIQKIFRMVRFFQDRVQRHVMLRGLVLRCSSNATPIQVIEASQTSGMERIRSENAPFQTSEMILTIDMKGEKRR
ncbi:hypothetical protein LV564_01270 [Komagataeibacter nataicola]|nr:hypothetical protein LV564_01270 [Komagataeibacter nataicola]